MNQGSAKAIGRFPRLLQLIEKFPESTSTFIEKVPPAKEDQCVCLVWLQSANVPCWMFIGWINQMVALLDKEEGSTVYKILIEIASQYPQVGDLVPRSQPHPLTSRSWLCETILIMWLLHYDY